MATFFDLSKNMSYYAVPAAMVLAFLPHSYATALAGKSYDIANPRKTEQTVIGNEKMAKMTKARILRAKGASANAFETLGVFAAGVVAANVAGVSAPALNTLSLGYVASRAAYNVTYIWLQDNRRLAPLRTVVWLAGVGMILALWAKAGSAAMAASTGATVV